MQAYLASALTAVAVAATVLALVRPALAVVERRRRPADQAGSADGLHRLRLPITSIAHIRRLLPSSLLTLGRRDCGTLIARAGLDGALTSRDVTAARVLCGLVALALMPRVIAVFPARMLPLVLAALMIGAAELPIIWLKRRARLRSEALRAALPDALELLHACLAAGLSLRRALGLVGDHCAEPVATEFICVSTESALGVSQSVALDGLAARNPEPEIRTLVAAIRQAEQHGSGLAPAIAAQAEDARLALDREILQRAAKAGPKIQLIVSTTIVPGALLCFAAIFIAAVARGEISFL